MARAKTLTKAGRKIVDAEVKNNYHDEVLNWLIDNLSAVVADRVGLDETASVSALAKAKENFASFMEHRVDPLIKKAVTTKQVETWNGLVDLNAAAHREFLAAKEHLASVRKHASESSLTEPTIDGKVASYEVMKRVAYLETKPARLSGYRSETKEVPAGYVDLFASIFVPAGLRFQFSGVELSNQGSFQFFGSDDCVDFAGKVRPAHIELVPFGDVFPYFFSVRTDPFTLGEVLQELKELKQLEDRQQDVVLVVDNIDPSMRKKIEAEGLIVFARSDYT